MSGFGARSNHQSASDFATNSRRPRMLSATAKLFLNSLAAVGTPLLLLGAATFHQGVFPIHYGLGVKVMRSLRRIKNVVRVNRSERTRQTHPTCNTFVQEGERCPQHSRARPARTVPCA